MLQGLTAVLAKPKAALEPLGAICARAAAPLIALPAPAQAALTLLGVITTSALGVQALGAPPEAPPPVRVTLPAPPPPPEPEPEREPEPEPGLLARGLSEAGPIGPLPIIAEDGRTAAALYARASAPVGEAPVIGLIITDLGLSPALTDTALDRLPADITAGFSPYGAALTDGIAKAREQDREVVLAIPVEPAEYPDNDPGPHTLTRAATKAENLRRLEWVMSKAGAYFAIMMCAGDPFVQDAEAVTPPTRRALDRGVAVIACGTQPPAPPAANAPVSYANTLFPMIAPAKEFDQAFLRLETAALRDGSALGVIPASPGGVRAILAWIRTAEAAGYKIVPASAILAHRSARAATQTDTDLTAPPPRPTFRTIAAGYDGKNTDAGQAGEGGGDYDADKKSSADKPKK